MGASAGTIVSNPLTLGTGWISKPKGEAGVELKPAGEVLFEFECETFSAKEKGFVAGTITPINLQSASGMSVAFNSDTLSAEVGGSTTPSSLKQELPIRPRARCMREGTPKEKCKPGQAEINTLAGSAPEFGRCFKLSRAKHSGQFADANCATLQQEGNFEFEPIPG
jgi:hypothetical protein